jgi:RNA polymerase sigma factor for flagellar operon FliA
VHLTRVSDGQIERDELVLRNLLNRGCRPGKRTKERIFRSHARIIFTWHRKIGSKLPEFVDRSELLNAGVIGFLEALDRFDPRRETKLKTFLDVRVKGAMLDYVRKMYGGNSTYQRRKPLIERTRLLLENRLKRRAFRDEMADALGITLNEYDAVEFGLSVSETTVESFPETSVSPKEESSLLDKELLGLISKGVLKLTEKEQEVITRYYWGNSTWLAVAESMDLRIQEVQELRNSAYLKLKNHLNGYGEL